MRSLNIFLLWSAIGVGSAASGQAPLGRPVIAPPPSWVIPASAPKPPASASDASTVNLLADLQSNFSDEGDSNYFESSYQLANSKGLDQGSLQLDWDPALEVLTLHRYRLVRDGQAIDLLGDGSKLTIVRREPNLDSATLDGRLTATLQPEDLRVGDIIDLAYTKTRRDPAMGGKSEALSGPNDATPYGRYRVRMIWPASKQMKWRTFPGVLKPQLTKTAAGTELVADMANVVTPRAPQGAPSRFSVVNAIEISEFADWASVSRTAYPLYAAAATLSASSPLKAEAAKIAAQSHDPRERAGLALQLVENQIRYLYLGMDGGGYVPTKADLTWTRRFGDCKAKTVLLVALLRELGIDARPVLVSTEYGDLVTVRLPMMGAFDHAIVEVRIGGKSYWLDGTRLGDTNLDRLQTPAYHAGLPIVAGGTGLIPLAPAPFSEATETIALTLDARGGIDVPAPALGEMRFRGESATNMRVKFAGYAPSEREDELRQYWRKTYDFVTPNTVATRTDEHTGDFILTMDGTAKMDWFTDADARWYELDRARLGWKFDMVRDGAILKDAPFAFDYPDYFESRETIRLPRGGSGFRLQGESTDQTIGNLYAFHRKVGIDGDTLTLEASTRALAAELPANRANQVHDEMAALAAKSVYVRVPDDYLATDGDIAAHQDDRLATAKKYMVRGALQFDKGRIDESLADEDRAVALNPKLARAHAIRSLVMAAKGRAEADAEADQAIALDSNQALAWRAKGTLALNQKRYADADKFITSSLAINGKDARALVGRGTARMVLGRSADALADIDAAVALDGNLPLQIIRAAILEQLGRHEESLAAADRAVALNAADIKTRLLRAELRNAQGQRDAAIDDVSKAIALTPDPELYIQRARMWVGQDAKRDADIEAALRLDSRSLAALTVRAEVATDRGDVARAEQDIAAIETIDPSARSIAFLRKHLREKQGRYSEALQIIDTEIAKHPGDAGMLNERCWLKATRKIHFDTALADCDAALTIAPKSPAALDSRAFTRLRMGQTDAAIADYDAALALAPNMAASLLGRAIAHAQRGESVKATTDLILARKLAPEIEARFKDYGVQFPNIPVVSTP